MIAIKVPFDANDFMTMTDWLKENIGHGGYYDPSNVAENKWTFSLSGKSSKSHILFTFKDHNHALMFKLRFTGKRVA